MLDLLISYINFLILSISYIVTKFSFHPPDPPKYLIKKNIQTQKEEIFFVLNTERQIYEFKQILKNLDIEYDKIINDNQLIPIIKIKPLFHLSICIIYCKGNSGDLGTGFFEIYEISLKCNCITIIFEYPGFGICKNDIIKESEFYKRIKAVYYYAINTLNFKPNQIILFGFSLGAGIALDLACRKECPVAGLILNSPFLSALRTYYNIKKTKYFDLFNNCDKAKYLNTKTFFIHGTKDTFVPYIHGKILAKLIPQEYYYDFLTIQDADHNNLFKNNKDLIFKKIRQFIKDCTGYYTDFSKISLDESSSNSTVDNNDNNINPNDTNDKINDENKDTLNNMDNLSDKEIIRQKKSLSIL
jgi:dienelactone hydrolase